MRIELLGDDHPDVARVQTNLADLLVATSRYDEAYGLATKAKAICTTALSPQHWRTGVAASVLGASLTGLKRYEEAEPLLVESFATVLDNKGPSDAYTIDALQRIIKLYETWGRADKAAEYRVQLAGS